MVDEAIGAPEAPQVDVSDAAELQETTAPQELESTPTESTGDDQSYTVKVNGETIQVSLQEALSGYQRQADYTQKTQELAAQREELSYAERIASALETNPEGAIRALMAAYEFNPQQLAGAPQAQEPDEPLDPVEALQQRFDSFVADQEQRAYQAQVQAEFAELHNQFGQFDENAVIQYAIEHGIPSIPVATKAYVMDTVQGYGQRMVQERQAESRKSGLPPVAGGHGVAGGSTQTGGTAPATSVREALALAEASLGMSL